MKQDFNAFLHFAGVRFQIHYNFSYKLCC